MKAKVSIDKFVVEYTDVPRSVYYALVSKAVKSGELFKQKLNYQGYGYQLHLKKADGAYLHVFYRNWSEPKGMSYTLRLETRPEYYFQFKEVLDTLRRIASGIYFVSCDVAYDVRTSMDNVVVIPHDGRRKLRGFKGTRYFGKKHQRKTNGHCKIYNKQLELFEKQNRVIDHELTRTEIVYKPAKRIPLAELLHHPPEQNDDYFAAVITDWNSLPKKRAEQACQLRDGVEIEKKKDWYTRKVVKETLAPSSQVNFDELAREAWKPLLAELCGVLLGQQKPQVRERPLQMAVTNTVYDSSPAEHDNKNKGCADFGKYRILRNNKGKRHKQSETFLPLGLKKSRDLIYIYQTMHKESMDWLASRCGLRKQLTLELRLPTWFQYASDLMGKRKDDMHYKAKHIYIGIDLHKKTHTAVVVNCWHEKLGEVTFENKPSAFPELIAFVKQFKKRGITPIYGLEDVGGYGRALAVYLLEQKQLVKEVNSALSYAERKSNPIVQKSDSWDAECVAKILLNKLDMLPDANPQDVYWTIGQLVTRRNGLIKALTSLKNQLHMQLSYHYPSYKKFFSELDGKCALAFWHKYPSPYLLKGETVETLAHFLRLTSNNACSTRKAEQLLAWIQADGDTTRTYQEQRDFLIRSHVRDIRFNKKEIARVEDELHNMMKLPDLQLETMPGIDLVTSSTLVAEIGDIHRFASADKLARFAGIAPVKIGSGGKHVNLKSRQGNRVLHGLFYNLAVQQVQVSKGSKKPRNPLFYEYFNRKKEEGKTPTQALVCVMRRLVSIIYGMMKNKTAFRLPEQTEKQAS